MIEIEDKPIYRCVWCIKDTRTNPCEFCGSDQVALKDEKHNCHWLSHTVSSVKCKICDKIISYDDYSAGKY
jgi:hypothetical protein